MKELIELVDRYKEAIHTGNKEEFMSLWSNKNCTLISISKLYEGVDSIYNDFLRDGIHNRYSKIDLISDDIKINMIDNNKAIIIFRYHTECTIKDTNETYGIKGLETQIAVKEDTWKLMHVHYSKES